MAASTWAAMKVASPMTGTQCHATQHDMLHAWLPVYCAVYKGHDEQLLLQGAVCTVILLV